MHTFVQTTVVQADDALSVLVAVGESLHVVGKLFDVDDATVAMDQPLAAVVVEQQRSIVVITLQLGFHRPRSRRIFRRIDIGMDARAEEHIEQPVVVAQRCCPLTTAIDIAALEVVGRRLVQTVEHITDDFPVLHVTAPHNGSTGRHVARRRNHVVILSHANHVGVGNVAPQHGVHHLRLGSQQCGGSHQHQQHCRYFLHIELFV